MSTLVVYGDTSDGVITASGFVSGYGSNSAAEDAIDSNWWCLGGTGAITDEATVTWLGSGYADYDDNSQSYATYHSATQAVFVFNTSALSAGDTVTAAVLDLYGGGADISYSLRVFSGGTLDASDWGANGAVVGTSSGWGASNSITCDSSKVVKAGTTRWTILYGLTPSWAYAADQTGTTSDPKLTVTHSSATAPAAGMPLAKRLAMIWSA